MMQMKETKKINESSFFRNKLEIIKGFEKENLFMLKLHQYITDLCKENINIEWKVQDFFVFKYFT